MERITPAEERQLEAEAAYYDAEAQRQAAAAVPTEIAALTARVEALERAAHVNAADLTRQDERVYHLAARVDALEAELAQHAAESYHTAHESTVGRAHPRPDDR